MSSTVKYIVEDDLCFKNDFLRDDMMLVNYINIMLIQVTVSTRKTRKRSDLRKEEKYLHDKLFEYQKIMQEK